MVASNAEGRIGDDTRCNGATDHRNGYRRNTKSQCALRFIVKGAGVELIRTDLNEGIGRQCGGGKTAGLNRKTSRTQDAGANTIGVLRSASGNGDSAVILQGLVGEAAEGLACRYIDDQAGNNITKMRAAARRLKAEYGLGLIIVDYLQLMTTNKNYDSMVNQVTEISRSLKSLARELDVPVIALSQLSRAVEQRGGKPRLSDLRDSGSIEQDADVVMFIHRDDKQNENSDKPGIAEIMIEKHRNGPTGSIELFFDGRHTTFREIDKGYSGGADKAFDDIF